MALMQTQIATAVQSYIKNSDAYKSYCKDGRVPLPVEGLDGYPLAESLRLFARKSPGRVWAVCSTEDSALQVMKDGGLVAGGGSKTSKAEKASRNAQIQGLPEDTPFYYIPSSGKTLYSPWEGSQREYEQMHRLATVYEARQGVIVTHLRAFVSPVVSPKAIADSSLELVVNASFDPSSIAERLSEGGYFRSPSTGTPGEFSIRGEVIDVFPHEQEFPVRIYADWDRIDRICLYDPISQETIKSLGRVKISILGEQNEVTLGSIEPYIDKNDYFFFIGDERLETSFHSLEVEAKALYRTAFQADRNAAKPQEILFDYLSFKERWNRSVTIIDIARQRRDSFRFDIEGPRSYFGNFTMLREELGQLTANGWKITIFTGTELQHKRLAQMLQQFPDIEYVEREISGGFAISSLKVIAVCDHEIFGRRKQVVKTLHHVQSSPLDSFVDLKEGDYVVHVNYGIGRFVKIDRVKMGDKERDYIKILYAGDEHLYVPIEQANLIQRYIGSEGGVPKLDKLGGQGWENKKAKARKSAEELAGRLIKLYARRKNTMGYPFAKDTDWQLQFEASFPFDETEDQLTCIDEIKQDMESPIVMDRLVCGDVGYGKTEIAFRAAFKAVMSGKQVAFLAPTTILAEQHYSNFLKRLGDFPVKAAQLSRIVPKKEQTKTLKLLASGGVDVLFGTHRILQKDVAYNDLGLLIVDEEQRFGVKDKEKIKELRTSVDSLSLSATPIPRTLYMSLLKIRDMSLLTTPPIARRPIRTVIQHFDEDMVERAIRFEVARGGQVFYLHNRIETLDEVVVGLQRRMPELIIESAHGQMDSAELEDTMRRFVHEGIQVLVATTIIENGIDIPNVNTIIIDRADIYGVSQLYQLRGRVGRSDKEAYAYLFYPEATALSELAVKRLKVISEHTELGAGFKVAMKDMEIRGTGNLLGREQSGQMSSVGLDMYLRILDETIADLQKSGDAESQKEVFLELDYSGFIPDTYIKAPSVKFEIYKKISSIQDEEQLQSLTAELEDRFGQMPEEVANLLYIAELKIICRKLSIYHLAERNGVVTIEFSRLASLSIDKVIELIRLSGGKVRIDAKRMNFMEMRTDAVSLKDKALFILEKLQRLA